MAHTILDGQGTGRQAGVNLGNELKVHSTTLDMQNVSAIEGTSFVAYLKRNIGTGGGGNEVVGVITYDGDNRLYVSHIHCSSNGTASNIEGFFSPFTSAPTGGTTLAAVNLNRSSGVTSDTTIITGATTITMTEDDALEFFNARLSIGGTSSYNYQIDGAVILEKGDSLAILGSSDTTGDKLRVQVWWFESAGEG